MTPDNEPADIAAALSAATASLTPFSATPRLDAELLMAFALDIERRNLPLIDQKRPSPEAFQDLVARRMAREPVAYIVGSCGFWTLDLNVRPGVLIPRPDSETLVEAAISARRDTPPATILDMGTGSGALLLSLLDHWKAAKGIGIDASPAALEVAQENARLNNVAERSSFHLANWNEDGWHCHLGGPFDMIVCNPPYVETDAELDPQVRDFEPHSALFAGALGLDCYRIIIPQLPMLLALGGVAVLELGADQASAVAAIAHEIGLTTRTQKDLGGHERALIVSSTRSAI